MGSGSSYPALPAGGWGKFSAGLDADLKLDLSLSFSQYQVDIFISVCLTPVTLSQLVSNFVEE